jgi:GAF domain-containing protein
MFDSTDLVKEMQEMRDDGFLSDALLRFAVRNIKEADERFDWVGGFLVTEEGNELWLHNYVGPRTEHAKIPFGEGVIGTAAAQAANQNVHDVSEFEGYIADHAETASELSILIRAGDEVFGLIDIDSFEPDAFNEDDEKAVGAVADKLAEQIMAERR